MKPLSPLHRRPARLVLPLAALLTTIGGATASAAPAQGGQAEAPARHTAGHAAKFTWHAFKLLNGWRSASKKGLVTGTPAWALNDGVVYLRGAITQSSPGKSDEFSTLPKYARSPHNLYLQVFTSADVPGNLFIGSSGTLEAYEGNADTFTSLGAVSYPTAAIKSHKFTLKNGWQSSQSIYKTGNPAYAISNGVVYLSGSMHANSNPPASPLAFILPKAARPAHELFLTVYTVDGASPGVVEILPQGEVDFAGAGASSYTSLAAISFPVASTKWHNFKLVDDWKSAAKKSGTAAPSYAVVNGVVYLNGAMYQSPASNGLWTVLPAAARTADVTDVEVSTTSTSVGAVTFAAKLGLAGSMPFSNAQMFTSLAGIAYPPSS